MKEKLDRAKDVLTSTRAKRAYATGLTLTALAVLLWGIVLLAGPIRAVIYSVTFLFGLGLLPGIWYVLGKSLPRGIRGVVARITWTIAALIHGPYAAYWQDSGAVDIVPAKTETDQIFVDDEWIDFDPDGNWSRLGKTEFVVTYEKDLDAFDGTAVHPEADIAEPNATTYLGTRGGKPIATRIATHAENVVVDLGRVTARWRGAAGGVIADAAKKDALIEYGGQVDISTRWLVIGIVSSLALGTISGYVLFAA